MNVRHRFDNRVDLADMAPGVAVPVEAFLEWLGTQEGRFEYDRGTIGMMVRVTQNHALIVSRFIFQFMRQLPDDDTYQVLSEAFAVHIGSSVRFPDVLIQKSGADGRSLKSEQPLVIVEVVSPSSHHLDTVVKRDEYLSLRSLQVYVIASQDEPEIEVWLRGPDGSFPETPLALAGFDATLALPSFGLTLPLAELYRHMRA